MAASLTLWGFDAAELEVGGVLSFSQGTMAIAPRHGQVVTQPRQDWFPVEGSVVRVSATEYHLVGICEKHEGPIPPAMRIQKGEAVFFVDSFWGSAVVDLAKEPAQAVRGLGTSGRRVWQVMSDGYCQEVVFERARAEISCQFRPRAA